MGVYAPQFCDSPMAGDFAGPSGGAGSPPPSYLTITTNHLTTGADTAAPTVVTTASVTPTANAQQLIGIVSAKSGGGDSPSGLVSTGLTWTEVGSVTYGSSPIKRLSVWKALGASPVTGTLVITFPATQTSCLWSWVECTNVNTGAPIVQSGTNTGATVSTLTVTLAAFANVENMAVGFFANTTATHTPGSGFAEHGDILTTADPISMCSESKLNDETVDVTFSAARDCAGFALEIQAGTA